MKSSHLVALLIGLFILSNIKCYSQATKILHEYQSQSLKYIYNSQPKVQLNLEGTRGGLLRFLDTQSSTTSDIFTHDGKLHLIASKELEFGSNGQFSRMNIGLNGNVGINTNTPAYKLDVAGDIQANGGWVRVKGKKGVYFQDYGGGLYMTDNTWIRTFNNKNFYHNTGIMRTDGDFHVGSGGNRFLVDGSGRVGIGIATPSSKLHIRTSSFDATSTANKEGSFLIEATSATKTPGTGASLGFVVPAYTNGSGLWQQGRILVTPDNTNNARADGRMYLQTRYYNGEWSWRNNLVLRSSGNVGIGTSSPSEKLEVNGNIRADYLTLDALDAAEGGEIKLSGASSYNEWKIDNYRGRFRLHHSGSVSLDIQSNGNVGIGTHVGENKLEVNGTIRSSEIKVEANNWPDYVFMKDYKLSPLSETATFIEENGHLPEMPSAKTVEENGIELGVINTLLVKKIEELTLHLINQQKEIEELKKLVK